MYHGEIKKEETTVGNGKHTFHKRKKFCVLHGLIDLVIIGGELNWQNRHGKCNEPSKPKTGAEFKSMSAAA